MLEKIINVLSLSKSDYNIERCDGRFYIDIYNVDKKTFDFFNKETNAYKKDMDKTSKIAHFNYQEKNDGVATYFHVTCYYWERI